MYANAAAVPRPEISAFLEEVQDVEKNLFAEKILPVYTSDEITGRYPRMRIDKGELLRKESTLRSPKGTYNEVGRKHEWDVFNCEDRGLEELVDDVITRQMKRFFDAEVVTGKLVQRSLMLDYEVRVADLIMNPNTFNATAASADYTEANIATIDVAKDIEDAQARMEEKGVIPNTLVLSRRLLNRIRRSTKFQTFVYGKDTSGHQRMIDANDIAKAFGFENVHVSAQTYNAAEEGATMNLQPCWGNDYMALLNVQSGDFTNGGVGRTVVWGADSPGGLYVSETYRCEERRGDMVRVRMHTDEKILSEIDGELITTGYTA